MVTPLLFPLNRASAADIAALQLGLSPAVALVQPPFARQKTAANAAPPRLPINLPWDASGDIGLVDVAVSRFLKPPVVHQLLPYPPKYFTISGTTKDSTGAALGSCVVKWYRTADDTLIDQVTSDASGAFEFRTAGQPPTAYYLVAYKPGSPDVAGTTANTLSAA